jgi:hypothetical protein
MGDRDTQTNTHTHTHTHTGQRIIKRFIYTKFEKERERKRGGRRMAEQKIHMVKMRETKHFHDRQIEKKADGQTE